MSTKTITSYSDKRSEKIYSPRFKKRLLFFLLTILYLRDLRPKETFEGFGENKRRTKKNKEESQVYKVYLKSSSIFLSLPLIDHSIHGFSCPTFTRFLGRRLETVIKSTGVELDNLPSGTEIIESETR